MKVHKFEELEIWKLSTEIAVIIYKMTKKAPFIKDYGLTDQLRRASVSVASNITEGFERNNNNEFIYFLRIAKGSCGELRTQLYISKEIGYITEQEFLAISDQLVKLSSMIGKFARYLQAKKSDGEFSTR